MRHDLLLKMQRMLHQRNLSPFRGEPIKSMLFWGFLSSISVVAAVLYPEVLADVMETPILSAFTFNVIKWLYISIACAVLLSGRQLPFYKKLALLLAVSAVAGNIALSQEHNFGANLAYLLIQGALLLDVIRLLKQPTVYEELRVKTQEADDISSECEDLRKQVEALSMKLEEVVRDNEQVQ